MVPPAKPGSSPVRPPPAPAAPAKAQARPLAFKALLMRFAPPNPAPARALPAKAAAPAIIAHPPHEKPKTKTPDKGEAHDERKPKERVKDAELLDPSTRMTAQLAPPLASSTTTPSEQVTQRSRMSLEELIPHVVRRIAWGGDRAKGSAVLELTSGDRITVHAEGRRVRIEAAGNAELERRIESRLRAAGIEVESVG